MRILTYLKLDKALLGRNQGTVSGLIFDRYKYKVHERQAEQMGALIRATGLMHVHNSKLMLRTSDWTQTNVEFKP